MNQGIIKCSQYIIKVKPYGTSNTISGNVNMYIRPNADVLPHPCGLLFESVVLQFLTEILTLTCAQDHNA